MNPLRHLSGYWRARLSAEHGFTMLLALFVLMITTLLLGSAYMAVAGDVGLSHNDLSQKQALSAAQAGIAAYNYDLNQNPNYWELCASATAVAVPGSATETYTTAPLVASTAPSGTTSCSTANPIATMIEAATLTSGAINPAAGTFRISSTGTAGSVSRTIVAQYKRSSFLDFVYYTDYETIDPAALPGNPADCARHYGDTPARGVNCSGPISFVTGDVISGPLHSEDTLAICGNPVFGRTSNDQIQAPGLSTEHQSGCTMPSAPYTAPFMTGTYNNTAPSLTPPPTDSQILALTQPAYHFVGATTIVLAGASMTVTNPALGWVNQTVAFPSNGVVYVSSSTTSACSETYTPYTANATYPAMNGNPAGANYDPACGNAYISGNYNASLTIATDNDIIINGNLSPTGQPLGTTPTGTALLGLIANNFVRLYHPVNGNNPSLSANCRASNANGSLANPYIYAAILAVNHSFIVDNFNCGSALNNLTLYGTVAQLFRGPVGTTSSGTVATGYIKKYTYDDRLATIEPPDFLSPLSAAWYVQRQTECDITAACR